MRTAMSPWIRAAGILLMAAAVLPLYAAAGAGATSSSRQSVREVPLKNCTRLNGRMGYYGNPWCTAAEQARWDRWDARRVLTK